MHPRSIQLILTIFLGTCLLSTGSLHALDNQASADHITLLDGTSVSGQITSIDPSGRIAIDGISPVHVDGLRQIQRPTTGAAQTNRNSNTIMIDLGDGGRVWASRIIIADENCEIRWKFGQKLVLPLESIRAIRFEDKSVPSFQRAVAGHDQEFDQIFTRVDGELTTIKAFVEELDDEQLVFEWQNERHSVPRISLHGIVVAQIGEPPDRTGLGRVTLDDGSIVWGKIEALRAAGDSPQASSDLTLRLPDGAELRLPWDAVTQIKFQSQRLVYLSDLTPIDVKEQPIVAFPRKWQANKSVLGRPLQIGPESFDTGLGVQARSRLTFVLDRGFGILTATIGIDRETDGRGDCIFIVFGDDKELFRRRIKGSDDAYRLRVSVQGVERLSLLVEPGEDLDFGDHADWCEACLLRPAQ